MLNVRITRKAKMHYLIKTQTYFTWRTWNIQLLLGYKPISMHNSVMVSSHGYEERQIIRILAICAGLICRRG